MGGRVRAVDVVLGVSGEVVRTVGQVGARVRPVLVPVARVALHPPLVPSPLQPAQWLAGAAQEGAGHRERLGRQLARWLDDAVPALLAEVLGRAAVTELLRRYVDLDEVVAGVDLDAAAARVDVDAVARRLDLDAVVRRVDVDSVVRRVDLDAAVRRVDLEAVLDRIDLTAAVLRRVDLDAVVQAVLDRIDLIALAEEVIDGVDLPEIIRESTGSMASDTVQGVRMQGINADEAVGRAVDRLLLRRGRRSTEAPASRSREAPPDVVPAQREPGP